MPDDAVLIRPMDQARFVMNFITKYPNN